MSGWEGIDWDALAGMREGFLAGTAGRADYWASPAALDSYDRTFGRRIGWKWDYVLAELARRGWSPPAGEALDWGCGTGVASRAMLRHFGAEAVEGVALYDRSSAAVDFARARIEREHHGVRVRAASAGDPPPATLLVSHVLTELDARPLERLVALASRAASVVWVEPGTHEASRRLVEALREPLLGRMRVVGPCTHERPCGMRTEGMERHWCHHFADPPPEVFTEGEWARFGRTAGIDLRSLPLQFIALDSRPRELLPPDAVRLVGRPRMEKGAARVFGCDASGVHERRILKRDLPEAYRAARRGRLGVLWRWGCEGGRVTALEPLE